MKQELSKDWHVYKSIIKDIKTKKQSKEFIKGYATACYVNDLLSFNEYERLIHYLLIQDMP